MRMLLHHMQAQRMHTHTTSLCIQACVSACILMPRNPNLSFSASISLFLLHNMPLFWPSYMFF